MSDHISQGKSQSSRCILQHVSGCPVHISEEDNTTITHQHCHTMCSGCKDGQGAAPSPPSKPAGYVFSKQINDTIPIYHWVNKSNDNDHFYTSDPANALKLEEGDAFTKKGVAYYLYPKRPADVDSWSLFRWSLTSGGPYLYTVGDSLRPPETGYQREAILGFVLSQQAIPPPGTIVLPLPVLTPTADFKYDSSLTAQQQLQLEDMHLLAYNRAGLCSPNINVQQIAQVQARYLDRIYHGTTSEPKVNAEARGSNIWVNPGIFFSLSNNEQAQTLLHEMMHCCGYTHPPRRDAPDPHPDTPFDGGPYYSTVPLMAEISIAGNQNLTGAAAGLSCPVVD